MLGALGDENELHANTNITCVITRFQVRSPLALLRCYRSFRRVRAHSKDVRGLMATVFAIESPRVCYTLSMWQDEAAILQFNTTVLEHVRAANGCFRDLDRNGGKPMLWSARFRLSSVSAFNRSWLKRECWLRGPAVGDEAARLHE
jgi:hypothetical protein